MRYALNFCELVGIFVIVVVSIAIVYALLGWIKESIEKAIYHYRFKHRFDRPPRAKCYCLDCVLHDVSHLCKLPGNSRYTPDTGFCYEAEPRSRQKQSL